MPRSSCARRRRCGDASRVEAAERRRIDEFVAIYERSPTSRTALNARPSRCAACLRRRCDTDDRRPVRIDAPASASLTRR